MAVSAPAPFKPSESAYTEGKFKNFVVLTITITNNSTKNYDPTLFRTNVQSGDEAGESIFDSSQQIELPPQTSLLPGRKVTFKVAFGVKNPKDLIVQVAPGFEYDSSIFTN